MKIPEKFIPLGPEMAFKLPNGEFLPMWVCDDNNVNCELAHYLPIIDAVKMFDGKTVHAIDNNWCYCMPMEGHPIPESALLKKPSRMMTNREVAELLGRYCWGEASIGDGYFRPFLAYNDGDAAFEGGIRKWRTDKLVAPTFDLLETARKEAGEDAQ